MALDIFFGLILLCSVLLGIRSGFLAAVFHTCGWLIAVICAFVFNSKIRGLLSEHTHIYESIKENISQKFSEKVTQPIADALPVRKRRGESGRSCGYRRFKCCLLRRMLCAYGYCCYACSVHISPPFFKKIYGRTSRLH